MLLQAIHELGNIMATLERHMNDLDCAIDELKDDKMRRQLREQYNELLRCVERHEFSTQHLLDCMEDVLLDR